MAAIFQRVRRPLSSSPSTPTSFVSRGIKSRHKSHKIQQYNTKIASLLVTGQIRNIFFFLGRERVGEILIFTLSIVGDFGGAWSPATGFDGSGTWRAGALENTE